MVEGLSEEEATLRIGSVDEIVAQTLADNDGKQSKKERAFFKRKPSAGEIALLALGAPLWFPLLLSAFAIALSLYITLWALVIALWAVFASLAVCAPVGAIAGIIYACQGFGATGLATVAVALVCAGLSVFLFFACKVATEGTVQILKNLFARIKARFTKKEEI
jgi:uncharacterized membrane protein